MKSFAESLIFVIIIVPFKLASSMPTTNFTRINPTTPKMSVWARKAGGSRIKLTTPTSLTTVATISKEEEYEYSLENEKGESSEENHGCRQSEFWHLRGQRCVPLQCKMPEYKPRINDIINRRNIDRISERNPYTGKRDENTGECIKKYWKPNYYYWGRYHSGRGHRHYTRRPRWSYRGRGK